MAAKMSVPGGGIQAGREDNWVIESSESSGKERAMCEVGL